MSALDHRTPGLPPRKIGLDRQNKMIGGVCSGIARYFGMDPLVMRLGFVIVALVGVGSPVLIYLVLWLIGALMD